MANRTDFGDELFALQSAQRDQFVAALLESTRGVAGDHFSSCARSRDNSPRLASNSRGFCLASFAIDHAVNAASIRNTTPIVASASSRCASHNARTTAAVSSPAPKVAKNIVT